MSFLRSSFILAACMLASIDQLAADKDMDRIVLVRGQKLNSQDVLKQVEEQTGLHFEFAFEDRYGYRADYNNKVPVQEVMEAFKNYHRDFNNLDLELLRRSERGYVFAIKRDKLVEPQDQPEALPPPRRSEAVAPRAEAPASKGRDLQVEIVDRQRETSSSFLRFFQRKESEKPAGKEPEKPVKKDPAPPPRVEAAKGPAKLESLEDVESMKAERPAAGKVAAGKPKAGRSSGPGRLSSFFAGNGQPVRETHFSVFDNAGMLTGFMAPPILPSRLLENGRTEVGVSGVFLREDGSARTGALRGSYDGDLYMVHLGARIPFTPGIEAVLDLPAGMHTGTFRVAGFPNRDLSFAMSDAVVGVNGDLGPVLLEDLRLMGGLRVKLPTGSTDDLLGTRHFDAGGHLALQKAIGPAVCFAQAGLTYYGKNENYPALDTGLAGQASLGAEWFLAPDLSLPAAVRWGMSPVHEKDVPGYVKDDQASLQAGVNWRRGPCSLGLDAQAGLTDSVPDFGLGLAFNMRF